MTRALMLVTALAAFTATAPLTFGDAGGWLLLVAIVLATLISEDLTCIAAGLLVVEGRLDLASATAACLVGIFVGDILLFLAGRWLGRPALSRAPLCWFLTPAKVDLASDWARQRGAWVVLASRFLPGTRLPVYFAMGSLQTSLLRFLFWFALAVILWTPLLVGVTVLLGDRVLAGFAIVQRHTVPALLILGALIWLMVDVGVPLMTRRGRRLLAGRWGRWRNSEFWPVWLFYAPLIPYLLGLAVRHRDLLVFTAANPAMPAGGFISEPKHAVLRGLGGSSGFVAKTILLRGDELAAERLSQARRFVTEYRLNYPVVLKPDKGQRGAGVTIISSADELGAHVNRTRYDQLLQEYVPGHEFGVFYAREPDADRGQIFSITEKRMPVVTGDGSSTLEELILSDSRAICMASVYLEQNRDRLAEVPGAGESVRLVELGTHCRGAIFLDGCWLWTQALEERIDLISRCYEGFFFGRYDLRGEDLDALKAGKGFRIVELNGVTSEATHVYDPQHSLGAAYRALAHQWRLAYRIGAANHRRGEKVSTIKDLWALWSEYQSLRGQYE